MVQVLLQNYITRVWDIVCPNIERTQIDSKTTLKLNMLPLHNAEWIDDRYESDAAFIATETNTGIKTPIVLSERAN